MKTLSGIIIVVMMLALLGCGATKTVTRIETDTVTDLSGRWNDTDSRFVSKEMIADCLSRVWLTDFAVANGRKPVVTVGYIGNKTDEHIDSETFTKDFERELINSGQIKFVGSSSERQEVRAERMDQQEHASAQTVKKLASETGADYVLLGSIKSINDAEGNRRIVFYQTDLQLIHVETNEKAWIGTKKIKKDISN